MSVTVEVRLLSGNRARVQASLDEQVEHFKRRAQSVLQVGKGRLVDSSGTVLDAHVSVEDANVKDGDSLMLHITRAQVHGTSDSFAAIRGDGSAVSWGAADDGAVQHQLKNVQQIQTTEGALLPLSVMAPS